MTSAIAFETIAAVPPEKKPVYWPISDELRRAMDVARKQQGKTLKYLGDLAGVSESNVSQMLMKPPKVRHSQAVPKICEDLGIDFAAYLSEDPLQQRLMRSLAKLGDLPEAAEQFIEEVETLARRMLAERAHARSSDEVPAPRIGDGDGGGAGRHRR